jgi:hypothetical protein
MRTHTTLLDSVPAKRSDSSDSSCKVVFFGALLALNAAALGPPAISVTTTMMDSASDVRKDLAWVVVVVVVVGSCLSRLEWVGQLI